MMSSVFLFVVDLLLPTDLTMVSAATILRWRRPTCRLEIIGSGGCRGRNGGGKGNRDRGRGAAADETEDQRGSGDGGKKSGGGGGSGGGRG